MVVNIFGAADHNRKIKEEKGLINQFYKQIGQIKVEKDCSANGFVRTRPVPASLCSGVAQYDLQRA
jgi:hypothetical protein